MYRDETQFANRNDGNMLKNLLKSTIYAVPMNNEWSLGYNLCVKWIVRSRYIFESWHFAINCYVLIVMNLQYMVKFKISRNQNTQNEIFLQYLYSGCFILSSLGVSFDLHFGLVFIRSFKVSKYSQCTNPWSDRYLILFAWQ